MFTQPECLIEYSFVTPSMTIFQCILLGSVLHVEFGPPSACSHRFRSV